MRRIWQKYKDTIRVNCSLGNGMATGSVNYWRNSLFSTTMIFALPLCFIALVPSLFLITFENKEYITLLHFSTIGLMLLIAFAPRVQIKVRKLIFSLTVYSFATLLNILASPSSGSVLIYFYAACIYSIIIFDNKYAYWWSHIVLFISGVFALIIHFQLLDLSYNVDMSSVNEWIAVSANLIFVCYLSSALIPKIFIGLESHINEQHRLKNELENSKAVLQVKNKELEEYAFVASHDLQEPLRIVSTFMNKLSTGYSEQLDEKASQYLHYAEDGVIRMRQIMLDLLEYTKIGRTEEHLKKVNLNQLINHFLNEKTEIISKKSANIFVDELPTLVTYEIPITQIFHSLLDNAIKYSKEGIPPHILVQVIENSHEWKFCVKDNGIGIDPRFYDKIFVIFQSLQNRTKYDGTGIGLSIVKKNVELLGGKIWVESTLGEGSTFYFSLPKLNKQMVN